MPWCEPCAKFWSPNTVRADGSCPACGTGVGGGVGRRRPATGWRSVPWHFWLLLAALAAYLGWRFVQGLWWALTVW
ncbi:MAG: hypothetical protein ACKV2O_19715 [Acidimicrobiales bacterium]